MILLNNKGKMINLVGGRTLILEKKNEGFVALVWNLCADKHKGPLLIHVFLMLLIAVMTLPGECLA